MTAEAINKVRLSKPKGKNILDAYSAAFILEDALSVMAQPSEK